MHSQTRRLSTMMGTVAVVMLLAFFSSVALSQAEGPTAPPPNQEKAVKKGDPGQVQEQTVSLAQAVHFTDAKGQNVVVGPGEYRVEVARKSGLTLTPTDGSNPIVLSGSSVMLETPLAFSVPVSNDEYHLLLLLPNGKGVDVLGSPSGVRSRTEVNRERLLPRTKITLTLVSVTVTPIPPPPKTPSNGYGRYFGDHGKASPPP